MQPGPEDVEDTVGWKIWKNIPLFTGFYTSQLIVGDFFHQPDCSIGFNRDPFHGLQMGVKILSTYPSPGMIFLKYC